MLLFLAATLKGVLILGSLEFPARVHLRLVIGSKKPSNGDENYSGVHAARSFSPSSS
jgi:hypothetical protein